MFIKVKIKVTGAIKNTTVDKVAYICVDKIISVQDIQSGKCSVHTSDGAYFTVLEGADDFVARVEGLI